VVSGCRAGPWRWKRDVFDWTISSYTSSRGFRKRVYQLIKQLPPEERFALAVQMRRAAVSVTNNIAEGHGRWYYQENIHFCRISRGSLDELIDDFNTCHDESYGDQKMVGELKTEAYELIRRINGYLAYLRSSKQGAEV
jgi:four helix bundle protein